MPFMGNVSALPSGLSSFAIDAIKFSLYVLSVADFLTVVISGLVLVRTKYPTPKHIQGQHFVHLK
jgi:hypothetical protein